MATPHSVREGRGLVTPKCLHNAFLCNNRLRRKLPDPFSLLQNRVWDAKLYEGMLHTEHITEGCEFTLQIMH